MNTKINLTNEQYDNLVTTKTKPSPILKNCFFAFIVGGTICCIGQFIVNLCLKHNIDETFSSAFASIFLIFIGAFLTTINVYSRVGKIAGAGSTIPITGFSNSIVSPAIEFKSEGYILGIGNNMFKIAGPVLVYGITSSVILGTIYYFIHYIF